MSILNNTGPDELVTTAEEFNALQNIIRKKQTKLLSDLNDAGITYNQLTLNPYITNEDTDIPTNTLIMFVSNSNITDGGSGNPFTMLQVVDYLAGVLSFTPVECTVHGNIQPGYIYALQKIGVTDYNVLDVNGIASRITANENYIATLEAAFPEASQTAPTKLIMNGTRNILELAALVVNSTALFKGISTFNSPVVIGDTIAVTDATKIVINGDNSGVLTADSLAEAIDSALTTKLGEKIIVDARTPEDYELEVGTALAAGTMYFQVSE